MNCLEQGHDFKAEPIRAQSHYDADTRCDLSTTVYGLYCTKCGEVRTMQWQEAEKGSKVNDAADV